MPKYKKRDISLAQFVVEKREELGLSQEELACNSGLELAQIQSIESGFELFLPTTIRQKLAKGLKIENKELKLYEKNLDLNVVSNSTMNEIKELILFNSKNPNFEIFCPVCREKLNYRIAKLYDLEGNLILRPKANCPKCPFQLQD